MPSDSATNPFPPRAWLLTVFVIISNVAGNLLVSIGMKGSLGFIESLVSPFVIGGIVLLICWVVSRMTLMSWADLSYVLPVTAIGYVLSAMAGAVFLHEYVSPTRWLATGLIVAGTVLAGTTTQKTTPEQHE